MLRLALITTDNREDTRDFTPERPWFGTAVQALLDGFSEFSGDIEVHVISCSRARLPSPLRLSENVMFHSVYVPPWAWLKTGYLANILAVRRLLRKLQPDLVHGQGTERDCAMCAVFSGYPNLITIHGNMRQLARLAKARPWSFLGLTAQLESLAIRHAGGVVCISSHAAKHVAGRAKRTWSISNAVDPAFFSAKPHALPAKPCLLLVGDVLPHKNQLAFLQSITCLQADLPFTVRILGKCDPAHPYAAQLIHFSRKHPWCTVAGFVARLALRQEMLNATLLALPSREENLPMVILEAMACGLPVAASNVGGIPDLIEDRITGVLFDPLSPESIRDSIRSLLLHPESAIKLAENGHAFARATFQPEDVALAHIQAYKHGL